MTPVENLVSTPKCQFLVELRSLIRAFHNSLYLNSQMQKENDKDNRTEGERILCFGQGNFFPSQ